VNVTTGNAGLDLGQIIVALAAVLAALITVYTANQRHRRQLAHDRELRVEELVHDRDMRNREHIRNTVDASLEALTEATRALARLAGLLSFVEEQRSEHEAVLTDEGSADAAKEEAREGLADCIRDLEKPRDEAHAATMEMITNRMRLAVRLGEEHPVATLAEEVADCYRRLFDNLQEGLTRNRTEEERTFEDDYLMETVDPKAQEFVKSCQDWFRST
jgi:hypothetical protein